MLNSLRSKVDKLINKSEDNLELKKYELIKKIISNDNCFVKMDVEVAISIIMDLQFNLEDAKRIYVTLINEENNIF